MTLPAAPAVAPIHVLFVLLPGSLILDWAGPAEAFRIAESGRPGPVWIDIPKDVQQQLVEFDELPGPGSPAGPPAVVRDRRPVGDEVDADAQRGQCTHRRLAARSGAFDAHVQVLDALLNGGTASHFGRYLRSERGGLAGALEALTT